jgi:hypothetical protein
MPSLMWANQMAERRCCHASRCRSPPSCVNGRAPSLCVSVSCAESRRRVADGGVAMVDGGGDRFWGILLMIHVLIFCVLVWVKC